MVMLASAQAQAPDYVALARQAVEADLQKSGQPAEQFRIEVPGGPILGPDHVRLHRSGNAPGRARLSGRVVNGAWDPVGGMKVSVSREDGPGAPVSVTTSGAGEFEIPDLAPGRYRALFASDTSRPLMLSAGTHRILVTDELQPYFLFEPVNPPKPKAFLETYQENRLVRFDAIEFEEGAAQIEFTLDNRTAGEHNDTFGKAVLLSDGEWRQLRAEVAPFLKALYDVASGPERLRPFLSPRIACRIYYSGERRIPSIDEQRCALNLLDSTGLAEWFRLEMDVEKSGRLFFDWFEERKGLSDDQWLGLAVRSQDAFRNELRDAGLLAGEHGDLVMKYLLAATRPIVKVVVETPEPDIPLAKGTYYMLGNSLPIFFAREGGSLRLVCVLMAGG